MSILIKGASLPPEGEYNAAVKVLDDETAELVIARPDLLRTEHYPLHEIPAPHGDLIDREVVIEPYRKKNNEEEKEMAKINLRAYLATERVCNNVIEHIQSIPAVVEKEGTE